jgi:hypothetical protein
MKRKGQKLGGRSELSKQALVAPQGGAAPPAFSDCTFANEYEWSVWRLSQSQLILAYFSTSGCPAQAIKLFVFPLASI